MTQKDDKVLAFEYQDQSKAVQNHQLVEQGANQLKQENLTLTETTQSKQVKKQSFYRPDIDGLRTIAVSIVIIFHAWPQFMTGGFIGVDVFFVISGYLISGIIIKQTLKKSFSYLDFYSRRVKRIYPALILVLLTVLIISIWKLLQTPLKIVTKTMAASTVFGANIEILTYEKDYFDPDVKTNPLLHLWSLGVEQQFYIVWPCLIALILTRFSGRIVLSSLVVFTAFSFVFSIFSVYMNTKFAFYFPLSRFWQMAIGGLISYLNLKIRNKYLMNVLSSVSIVAILTTVWILNQGSLFPGWWALVPTLSAAGIILAGNEAFINKNVLSSKPFVFVGKISYPLYLWHWPLLVFSRLFYPVGSKSLLATTPFILLITFLLSVATYFFIEKPLRYRKSKFIVLGLLSTILLIGIISVTVYKDPESFSILQNHLKRFEEESQYDVIPGPDDFYVKDGRKLPNSSKNPKRGKPTVDKINYSQKQNADYKLQKIFQFPEEKSPYYRYIKDQSRLEVLNEGKQNKLFIVGDSHGWHLTYRFKQLYQQSLKNNISDSFPTVLSVIRHGEPFLPCNPIYKAAMELIDQHKPQKILFVHQWTHYLEFTEPDGPLNEEKASHTNTFRNCYEHIDFFGVKKQSYKDAAYDLETYRKHMIDFVNKGYDVYVAKIHLQGDEFNPKNMIDADGVIQQNVKPIRLSEWVKKNKFVIDMFQTAMKDIGVKLIDFSDHHCWNDICQVLIPSGYPTKFDTNHYTIFYNRYWASSVDFLVQFQKK